MSLGSLASYLEMLLLKHPNSSFLTWEIIEYRMLGDVKEMKSRFPASHLLQKNNV